MTAEFVPYLPDTDHHLDQLFTKIRNLTEHHMSHCDEYRQICLNLYPNCLDSVGFEGIPPLPISLFKTSSLKSISDQELHREFRSSGTMGLQSKIYLDSRTAQSQEKTLSSIMKFWLGQARRPMLIVDTKSVLFGNSARSAAIRGMSRFGRQHQWLLDDNGEIDRAGLERWLADLGRTDIFVFGFTFLVWKNLMADKLRGIDLSGSVLFHGGGWKRVIEGSVSKEIFRQEITSRLGISEIRDYYGLVEQLGNIWVEASPGVFVPPSTSYVLIRDPRTLEVVNDGSEGLVQLFSSLPESYPGHSILTEDIGRRVKNSHRCDVLGEYGLELHGRLPKAQTRGCSDAVKL